MRLALVICVIAQAFAFSPSRQAVRSLSEQSSVHQHHKSKQTSFLVDDGSRIDQTNPFVGHDSRPNRTGAKLAGLVTGVLTAIPFALAEEAELADLPPPYVPALFAVGLLAGVGILTGSLGDVMDEEASLGLQSGARAKKEIERSRSSYFKKK